jgi:phage gp36-like protein
MSYATLSDIQQAVPADVLVELTDDAGAGAVDDTVVDAALERASSEIDAYVGVRYAVPLETAHPLVKKLCTDLSVYYLYLRVGKVSDALQRTYDNAVRLLRDISKGIVSLGAEPEPDAPGHMRITVRARSQVFGSDELDQMP